MRATLLMLGILAAGCAADHVVVATLDPDEPNAGEGGVPAAAGSGSDALAPSGKGGSGASSGASTGAGAGSGGVANSSAGGAGSGGSSGVGHAGSGGSAEFSGGSGFFATLGGVDSSGPEPDGVGGGIVGTGGSTADGGTQIGAGTSGTSSASLSERVCACLGVAALVCGTDGNTYDASCGDGEGCLPAATECLHACPCLDDEPGTMARTWFPVECAPQAECRDGAVCMLFDGSTTEIDKTCSSQ